MIMTTTFHRKTNLRTFCVRISISFSRKISNFGRSNTIIRFSQKQEEEKYQPHYLRHLFLRFVIDQLI